MTHYYYYISTGADWFNTTNVYRVAVGESAQGRRDFLFLTAHSVDHGHYFEIVSRKSDLFVREVLQSLALSGISVTHVSARDFVRSLRANESLSLSSAALHNTNAQRKALDLGFRIQGKLNARRAG